MSKKETEPIEYYGYAIPKKRYYALDSILKYYNPKYLNSIYNKNFNEHDTNIELIKDIKNNLNINTPEEWNNTPGLNLINLNKLKMYTTKKIIMKLANWASDDSKNKKHLKIPVKTHPRFTNVDTMYLHYHKTVPEHIKKKEQEKKLQEKKLKQSNNNQDCSTNCELQNKLNYLEKKLAQQIKLNKHLIKNNESSQKNTKNTKNVKNLKNTKNVKNVKNKI